MDPKLLDFYNRELQHLREVGAEFAGEFPKIAGRLGLDDFECADPYVERLLEGFAFTAARVQLKLDNEFDRFTQHMLQIVYPHYLAPTPSMAVVMFEPDLTEGSLAEGFTIGRKSPLRSRLGKGEQTACEYRTAHDVRLWPLKITHAEYFTRDAVSVRIPRVSGVKAGFRIVLETTAGLNFDELSLDRLPLFLRGHGEQPTHIYEQLFANTVAVVVRPADGNAEWEHVLDSKTIRRVGFDEDEALLPYGSRSFQGYRLLEEYFALPQRYLFAELTELAPSVRKCTSNQLEILILLDHHDSYLDNQVDDVDFALFCTPVVNLFPKRADRIHLSHRQSEYQVIADRTRPVDYEIYDVVSATGYGAGSEEERHFRPFYESHDRASDDPAHAYFVLNRRRRKLPTRSGAHGPRSSYIGSETFVSLVDDSRQLYRTELQQLGMATLCTNRDLPLYMPVGIGDTDFTVQDNAPVQAVLCLAGPTKPRPSRSSGGEVSWRLINHLSLNYLSLLNDRDSQGASALRALLRLYGDTTEPAIRKQVDGVRSVSAKPIARPIQRQGPLAFVRGLEVNLCLEEAAFEGTGMFLLGAVLDEFFAKYVSLNSFTETVIQSTDRGEVMRWPARIGRRKIL